MLKPFWIWQALDSQVICLVPLKKSEWTRDCLEYPSVHMVKRHYGIVTEKYKLVHFYYDVDEWELYDRFSDLNEMSNVYNDPNYSEIKTKLKIELTELRNKYNDSRELDQYYIKKYLE